MSEPAIVGDRPAACNPATAMVTCDHGCRENVARATERLRAVAAWAGERDSFGGRLTGHAAVRRHLAVASVALAGARAVVSDDVIHGSPHGCDGVADALLRGLDHLGAVEAGRGVFDVDLAELRSHLHAVVAGPPDVRASQRATDASPIAGTADADAVRGRASALLRELARAGDLAGELAVFSRCAETETAGFAAAAITATQVFRTFLAHGQPLDAASPLPLAALAVTEPGGGSDLRGLRTRLRLAQDHASLHGTKTFVAGGMRADVIVVAAKLDDERGRMVLVKVDPQRAGVARTPLSSRAWSGVGFARVVLDGYEPRPADLVTDAGRPAGDRLLHTGLVSERLVLAAQQTGLLRRITDALDGRTRRWAGGRVAVCEALLRATTDATDPGWASAVKVECCSAAADVAEATARTTPPGTCSVSRQDDWASARACVHAAGTEEMNLSVVAEDVLGPARTDQEARE